MKLSEQRRGACLRAALLASSALIAAPAAAQNATWAGPGADADWNDNANWAPIAVPSGTATFNGTGSAGIFFTNAVTTVQTLDFTPGLQVYTFDICACQEFRITGAGIINPSAPAPVFAVDGGLLSFRNSSTSGNAIVANVGGQVDFRQTSSAGTADITNRVGGVTTFGNESGAANATITNRAFSATEFRRSSNAGHADITNNGGVTQFFDDANAASAAITNRNGGGTLFSDMTKAGTATIINRELSGTSFGNRSSADHADITNNGGITLFFNQATAGSATITNRNGGRTIFDNRTTAEDATIVTRTGSFVQFFGRSTGGNARFITDAGGFVDFSETKGLANDGRISAGSIEGGGTFYIGAGNILSVGGNGLSTEVSGVIADFNPCGCGPVGPGALIKTGTGTMTLSGLNTYTGGTTFKGGTVSVSQEANLGGLAGGLTFDGGILQITGTTFNSTTSAIDWATGGGAFDIANAANTFTVNQVLGGPGGLTKLGLGTLVLSGANSYGGGTTIEGGMLSISANNNIGTGPLTMLDGTTLQFTGSFDFTHPTSVAGDPTFDVTAANTVSITAPITDGVVPGDLVKTGTGTLILAANNTYTGGTTIAAGTLQLGDGGTTGSIVGNVLNNANFAINRSDTFGFDGLISGTGAFQQNGGGTTIFTANNTYTGGTTVAAGTLQLGDGGTTGSIVGNVLNNANFAINRSDTFGFDGLISGTGAFQHNGGGTTIFTANNTYTGGTTVAAGTLQLGDGGTTGSIVGNVLNNANFAINRSDTFGFDGLISGTGAFQQNGGGTTIFTAENTYTGGTTIAAGTLQLGDGGTTGSILGDVLNNGTLAINRSDLFVFGNVISGNGAVQQNGTGTTIFTANNTYTGGTTITAGTLQLGDGGTAGSIVGNVLNNANFAINRSDTVAFDGLISGTGAFQQNGGGTTIFTAENTYTGGTTIAAGTLQLGDGGTVGSIVGDVLNNGTFAINRSDLFVFGNVISGTGALQQNGTGVTVLTNTSTYTGGTTIAAGTLQLGDGGTTGSIVGNVLNNANFAINRSDTFGFDGLVSGTGAFQQNGGGTTIFTANNTYTGGTTIAAGTLQLGDGGTTGALTGSVLNNANLAFNRLNTYGFDGAISGNGAVQQNGGGTTIFTAENTYTGGTTITAGTLQLGDGGTSGSVVGNVLNNANFAINRSDTFRFDGLVSGTGAFQQTGGGTTIFTAENTYTGGTTIAAGTLQLGDGGTTGSILGDVLNNGTFAINRSGLFVFGNVISGTGAFQQNGTGTTIFTANNTYTGGTTITAGTLQLGDGGTSGSVVGNVLNNANFAINRSDTVAFDGLISGTGAFQQNGTGTTIFTANNTYTGGTTITAGTLQLGDGGTSGSVVGNVLNNANFAINRSDTFAFDGLISGTGAFQQNGGGTTIFTAENTYTGGTTITAGTLQLGDGGTSGSVVGNVLNNANFAINRSDTFAFDGLISGTGAFQQNGGGTTIFTAENTYTGGTTIAAGTLQLGDGGTVGSIVGDVLNNGTFAINRSDMFVFGNVISGTGALQQNGTGVTVLTNTSTYTGATVVNAGGLFVNGSIASSSGLTVNPGAFVAGTGTLPNTTISGGTLSPGNSIGTITVNGSLTFIGPGNYIVEVSPSAADRTNVTGTATLAGSVNAFFAPGLYTQAHYTILSAAGGLSGTFGGLNTTNLPAFLSASLSYTTTDVLLNLTLGLGQIAGLTRNERATGASVDAAFNAGAFPTALGPLLNLSAAAMPVALNALSGEVHASTAGVLMDESLYPRSAVLGRLRQASYGGDASMASLSVGGPQAFAGGEELSALAYGKSPIVTKAPRMVPPASYDVTFWAQGFGARGKFDGDGNATDVRRDLAGFFSGVDTRAGTNGRVGIAAGYTGSKYALDGRGSGNVETGHLMGYGGWSFGALNLRAGGAVAWHSIDTNRSVAFPGFFDSLTANYNGRTGQIFGEAGYGVAFGNVAVEPFAGAAFVSLRTDGANERGGAAALAIAASSFDVGYSTLGIRTASVIPLAHEMMLIPRASLAWQHAFNEVTPDARLAFIAAPAPFVIAGAPIARDSLLTEAGLDLAIGRTMTLGVSYVGQLAHNVQDHAAKGKFSWKF